MLTVDNLTVAFGPTVAVRGVSLHAEAGAVTGVLGANGAGKTSTLLGIHNQAPRRGGRITLAGVDVTGHDTGALVAAGIALCPQNRRLFPNMSIEDNLLLGAYGHPRKVRRARLARAYDRFGWLRDRGAEAAGRLSGGQQQAVAIARALMSEPKLVLLDEPSSGLSPVAVDEVAAILADIAHDGTAVVLVEQNVRLVRHLCDTAYVLAHGKVAASGPVTALLRDSAVSDAYLGTVH
ncbi:ABC transporter ATP-binding protein [Actinokineospora iranica]|uniref:Amino acid/amide ABC transporter ATP-binding protein 2, HAAT family n=1 Tax=Actinokineospora iranica TaxID=1271860 RepID=A0A1G6QF91_9PSEU|nr:ABC transporter ATP-binding protein [Actinokineospora iranica]SDC91140.1 amino acid/amide ABC transporter ATP-binding protein 2, HAAT family [Actinokineospora iranica]